MTFLDLDMDAADLAVELFFAGEAETLDEAAALAFDLQATIADDAAEWDLDSLEWQIAAAYAAAGA